MSPFPSITKWGKVVEAFIAGYRAEHVILAMQMFICIIITMLPVLLNNLYEGLDGLATIWAVIGAAVVLEPSTGNVVRKLAVRVLAVGVAAAMGVTILRVSYSICGVEAQTLPRNTEMFGHMVSIGLALCAALIMLHRQRWARDYEFAFFLCLLTLCIVTVPGLRQTRGDAMHDAGFRALNVLIGVFVAAAVSFVFLPIKARTLLRKQTAGVLLQTGDLAAWVMSQVGVQPGKDGNRMPQATGTDKHMRYVDDGLQAQLAPLFIQAQKLSVALAALDDLLRSASAEFNIFSRPHRFPSRQYRTVLTSLHISVGLLQSQLYFMATGSFSLAATRLHTAAICDAGLQLSVTFTALGHLSHRPRSLRRHVMRVLVFWRWEWRETGRELAAWVRSKRGDGSVACEEDEPGLADLDAGNSEDEEACPPPDRRPSSFAGGGLDSGDVYMDGDDPFSDLESGEGPGDPDASTRLSKIQLSKSQIKELQPHMRRLSMAKPLGQATGDPDHPPAVLEEGEAGSSEAETRGDAANGCGAAAASTSQAELPQPAARILALHKESLRLMAAGDATIGTLGSASLVQTAGCIVGLTRQAAAILAAVEPLASVQLHARMSYLTR